MCGIVAVLARPTERTVELGGVAGRVEGAAAELARATGEPEVLASVSGLLAGVDAELRGPAGLRALLGGGPDRERLSSALQIIGADIARIETSLDDPGGDLPGAEEAVNSSLVALKDSWWALSRDRLRMAEDVVGLLGERAPHVQAVDGWWAVQVALASLDRLEVRGRDSAGLQVLVAGHGLDPSEAVGRTEDPVLPAGSVRFSEGSVAFVYKAAAEIGELGDNVRTLRSQIRSDGLLARALEAPGARVTVVAHTRWASVGIISEPNAHPVDSGTVGAGVAPYLAAVLNGDIDNHAEIRQEEHLRIVAEITTDAKVIPTVVSRRMSEGVALEEAFRATVARFEGSVAIVASAACAPDELQLALRGSGQSLYVGLAEDAFVVASEPYGLVEETSRYYRLDGEATQGQIVVLNRSAAGTLDGLESRRYTGEAIGVSAADIATAGITTRDVDRRGFDHFLLKEITEAPSSFRKTLRGRIHAEGGDLYVRLGDEVIPVALAAAASEGRLRRVIVIGQGTAAVAARSVAAAFRRCTDRVSAEAMPATELSGWALADDMGDTLVVAISQSGTTTDTNRTVDLVRTRGAHVVAVVNRRNSDLAAKSHGVLYTSDGRDVEMSVASTKAFYAQVAAGWLLALGMAERLGGAQGLGRAEALGGAKMLGGGGLAPAERQRILSALRGLPDAMEEVLASREEIGRIAAAIAPGRRYWAVVGSGPDHIAALELRIKLSELCYRSISADTTEDKKHIDLSCEPMVLICAAGLSGPNADDAAKEVAIYLAHKAAPIVIAPEGEAARFRRLTRDIVTVPKVDPEFGFVLSAMAGHLFGYEAALSIDAQARMLRGVRAVIETAAGEDPDAALERIRPALVAAAAPFVDSLRQGHLDGNLDASSAVRLSGLLSYATGALPLEGYESESGKIGTPAALLSDLLDALSAAIDELSRPIDAIKHQAKTVTVGISRSEDALFGVPLVSATLAAGAAPDTLGYRALRTLAALDEGVAEILGYTRYRIDWSAPEPGATVVDQGGVARNLRSRTQRDPRLRGSKHRAAVEREVTVVKGASDGRTVVLVPEVKGQQVVGMTLLHVGFEDHLEADRAAAVLAGYRNRLSALSDAVTETEPIFDWSRLASEPLVDLLTEPVYQLARRWRPSS